MAMMEEAQRQIKELENARLGGRVIGLRELTGKSLNRIDVDLMLKKQPKTFNLYLLALEHLQDEKVSQQDKMGQFQIAGIHGLPKEWRDGVDVPGRKLDEGKGSYCPHGRILFPTWHRPYLAMMEQSIYYRMLEIAQNFKYSETYMTAAFEFRLPYWDYFRPRGGEARFPGVSDTKTGAITFPYDFSVPHVLELDEVMVVRPCGEDTPELMDNPLYCFRYPKRGGISPREWNGLWTEDSKLDPDTKTPEFTMEASRSRTVRHQTRYNNQKSDFIDFNSLLSQRREENVALMLGMLRHPGYKDYLAFSHTGFPVPDPEDPEYPKKQLYDSIETLHNKYHGICGGESYMSRVPVAAFDPIFWLHHCNIDRLIAKRQAINPTVWFPTDEDHLNKKGITERVTDDLFPVRLPAVSDDKKYWDSNLVRHIAGFGYTYSELQEYKDPQTLLEAMHDKYQWSLQSCRDKQKIPEEMKPIDVSVAPVFKYPDRTLKSMLSREDPSLKAKVKGVDPLKDYTPAILVFTLKTIKAAIETDTAPSMTMLQTTILPSEDTVIIKDPSTEIGETKPRVLLDGEHAIGVSALKQV